MKNRSNKQYSASSTRWLDRLTHFDISIQQKAGSNLKLTDFFSRNRVGGVLPEKIYNKEYVNNIHADQTELNLKYGHLFGDQSNATSASPKEQCRTQNLNLA